MKTNTTLQWKISKALGYFFHFIDSFDEATDENDVFELVASRRSSNQWETLIKKTFSEETLNRLKASRNGVNRLDFDDPREEVLREIWHASYARKDLRNLIRSVISDELKANPAEKNASVFYAQRVLELQRILRLTDLEREVLLVLAFLRNKMLSVPNLRSQYNEYSAKLEFVANCLGCDEAKIQEALSRNGKIRRYGCVDDDLDFNKRLFSYFIGRTEEPFENEYYTRWHGTALPWSFFRELAKEHESTLKRIIAAAKTGNPTHILIYGPPGTGKTSFVLSLVAELNRTCYMIRQNVSGVKSRGDSSPENRLAALQICSEQVDPDDCIIVVDEADKMLRGNENTPSVLKGNSIPFGDKCLLNSVLESDKVPTIWITNTPPDALDETSRRRFDYSIQFEPLNQVRRRMIWHDLVAQKKLEHLIDDAMQEKFASRYPVSLGGIALVLQNIERLSPCPAEAEDLVDKLMASHCRLFHIQLRKNKLAPARDYSLDGLNIKGSLTLEQVVQAVKRFQMDHGDASDRPRMNVLLSGDPGTGKTEFVKYLGMVLQTKVIVKLGSDLLDTWVGSTEHNIRNAFETAEKEKAILFLDEIDGLTQSRMRARHNWEVTQVDELLHCMENFDGIMFGATNFADNLDISILRRFTYKLEFDYLDEAGKKLFFERMFRTTLTPEEYHKLAMIPELAPGDFRTVRQSFYYLAREVNNLERIDALARESEFKHAGKFAPKQRIGF